MSIAPAKDPVVSSATVPAARHEPSAQKLEHRRGAARRRSTSQMYLGISSRQSCP